MCPAPPSPDADSNLAARPVEAPLPRGGGLRRLTFAVVMVFLSFSVALLVAEVGLRIAGVGDPLATYLPGDGDGLPRPFTRGAVIMDPCGQAIRHNADGYRGHEFTPRTDPEEIRVLMAGDSFVWGSLVADHETLPSQVEWALQQKTKRAVKVFNLARAGANLLQTEMMLRRYWGTLSPNLVVLVLTANDTDVNPNQPNPAFACGLELTRAEWFDEWLFTWSRAWGVVRRYRDQQIDNARPLCNSANECHGALSDAHRRYVHVRCFEQSLLRIRRDAFAAKLPLLMTLYPEVRVKPTPSDGPANTAEQFVERRIYESGAEVFNMRPFFAGHEPRELWVGKKCPTPETDNHPNGFAHSLVAPYLANVIAGQIKL